MPFLIRFRWSPSPAKWPAHTSAPMRFKRWM
ncbi:Uncharacterised protein [Vibrio cholerae]|nr:Uncharacterised protein [Vibrio cholerae]